MASRRDSTAQRAIPQQLAHDLKVKLSRLIDDVAQFDESRMDAGYQRLTERLADIFRRRRMTRTANNDVRDLLCETLFTSLKKAFHEFLRGSDWNDPRKAAESVLGTLVAADVCADFAAAIDRVSVDASNGDDAFSLGGLTDFISVEEILQLLGAGKHTGRLRFQHADIALDVYFRNGYVAFLNPARLQRRVLPTRDAMSYREIPQKVIDAAEAAFEADGTPLAESLFKHNLFRESEVREAARLLGSEVLYALMTDEAPSTFAYRRLTELPEFVTKHDLRLGVTPVLLEGSRRFDEVNNMRQVFPDVDETLRLQPDALTRLANISLSPFELKLLAALNEGVSARGLSKTIGMPLFETISILVRFARQGIVIPPGGEAALLNIGGDTEDSLQTAFQALDANDDRIAVTNALDKAFGVDDTFAFTRGAGKS